MLRTVIRHSIPSITARSIQTAPKAKTKIPSLLSIFGLSLFSTTSATEMSQPKVQKSDQEWRAVLSPEQFRVLRKQGTEAPGSSPLNKHREKGVYTCAGCDAPLYTSEHKFDSGCGWPAYFDAIPGAINRHEDNSMFMKRTEITCNNCGGHVSCYEDYADYSSGMSSSMKGTRTQRMSDTASMVCR